MITAKIIGATGYGGVGIIELLHRHPEVEVQTLVAKDEVGHPVSRFHPHLEGFCDLMVHPADSAEAAAPADVVFFSTPDGVGMRLAAAELERGAKLIDYSGDFRFRDPAHYAEYAQRIGRDTKHVAPELLPDSAYGLAELGLEPIGGKRIVGNPGCFAVSALMGLAPAAKHHLVRPGSMIADCKTGISGAGKKPKAAFHYPNAYDNMYAYKLAGHQHVCEVELYLEALAGEAMPITFTSQVVPATRGILSCCYGDLLDGVTADQVQEAYAEMFGDQYFVRLYTRDDTVVGTAQVRGSNHCNLVVDVDERTRKLRVISHIDNLMKGQAGSALQNMNLLFGFPEAMGLDRPGNLP